MKNIKDKMIQLIQADLKIAYKSLKDKMKNSDSEYYHRDLLATLFNDFENRKKYEYDKIGLVLKYKGSPIAKVKFDDKTVISYQVLTPFDRIELSLSLE